jgi:hypothetical protein
VTLPGGLVLLGKPGCHLCDVMEEVVARVAGARGYVKQDVRDDPDLRRRYALEIPVLFLDGREVARHRVTDEVLRSALDEAERAGR